LTSASNRGDGGAGRAVRRPLDVVALPGTSSLGKLRDAFERASTYILVGKVTAVFGYALQVYGREFGKGVPPPAGDGTSARQAEAVRMIARYIVEFNDAMIELLTRHTVVQYVVGFLATGAALYTAYQHAKAAKESKVGAKQIQDVIAALSTLSDHAAIGHLAEFAMYMTVVASVAYVNQPPGRPIESTSRALDVYRGPEMGISPLGGLLPGTADQVTPLEGDLLPGIADQAAFARLLAPRPRPVELELGVSAIMDRFVRTDFAELVLGVSNQTYPNPNPNEWLLSGFKPDKFREMAARINSTAAAALNSTIDWTQDRTNSIIENLSDLAIGEGTDAPRILYAEDGEGARWIPKSVLESITSTSWEALPETSMIWGQGVFVFAGAIERLAEGDSSHSVFSPRVMFTHTSDTLARSMDEADKQDELEFLEGLKAISSQFSVSFEKGYTFPKRPRFNPLTVPELGRERASDLLTRIPAPAGAVKIEASALGLSIVEGTFSPAISSWDDWCRASISHLEDIEREKQNEARKKSFALRRKIAAINEGIQRLDDAAFSVRRSGLVRANDAARTEADREQGARRKKYARLRKEAEAERDRLGKEAEAERERTQRALWILPAYGLIGGLIRVLLDAITWGREAQTNSAALVDKTANVYIPGSKSKQRVDGVADILVYAWEKLDHMSTDAKRFPRGMKTALAEFEDYPEGTGERQILAARHASRMEDIAHAYDLVRNDPEVLRGALSVGDLRIDDPRFWLRMYLWELVCDDTGAPYTAKTKENLFEKIRYGPSPEGAELCQNPDVCAKGQGGNRATSDVLIARFGGIWALLASPEYADETLDLRGMSKSSNARYKAILDVMHDQRKVRGFCFRCAKDKGILATEMQDPLFKGLEVMWAGVLNSKDEARQHLKSAAAVVAASNVEVAAAAVAAAEVAGE
jgi:hypothetical protein